MTRTACIHLATIHLATAAIVCIWSATTDLAAQSAPPTVCSAPAANADAPDLGTACSAVYNDPKSTQAQRVDALFFRGIWHHRANRLEAAARDYDAALQLDPDHAKVLQLRSNLFFAAGDLDKAKKLAQRSAEIDPSRTKTFEQLANIAVAEGELSEAPIAGERCLLLRPQTFMNASGEAVLAAMSFYKIVPGDVVVMHDELADRSLHRLVAV